MNEKHTIALILLCFMLCTVSFVIGMQIGLQESPCDKVETHQTIFIDEKGNLYRVNNRLPDTTKLMQLPRNVGAVKVLHTGR